MYFRIYGNNRWQKRKNDLCIKTKFFILLWLKKRERERERERERDYTLTTGLYNPFER